MVTSARWVTDTGERLLGLGKERCSSMGSQASCVLSSPDHRGKVDRQHKEKGKGAGGRVQGAVGPAPASPRAVLSALTAGGAFSMCQPGAWG